ncbi:unnamed protein product [Caenorhabditis sp. 36 PRJEB53466]|nr:unnamed protein product [Caenorhabditis sp. 36 PRJEB53466]
MTVPAAAVAEPHSGGRKRVTDGQPSQEARKRRKEEEKENRRKLDSSSPSSTSSRESSNTASDVFSGRRKKAQPVKRDGDYVEPEESATYDQLTSHYRVHGTTEKPRFLLRNVRKGQICNEKKSTRIVRKDVPNFLNKMMQSQLSRYTTHFSATFSKIMSWANSTDPVNETTSTAHLRIFTLLQKMNGDVAMQENGFSILPVFEKTSVKSLFSEKIVTLPEDCVNVFIAVVATRMTAILDKNDGNRLRSRAHLTESELKDLQYEKVTAIGCRHIFHDYKKMNHLGSGVKHIVVVDTTDDQFKEMMKDDKDCTNWMENLEFLRMLDLQNHKVENSHLPRVFFSTNKTFSDEDDDEELGSEGDERAESEEPQRNQASTQPKIRKVPIAGFRCKFRKTVFPTYAALKASWKARYPCFVLKKKRGKITYHENKEFFREGVCKHENFCLGRRTGKSAVVHLAVKPKKKVPVKNKRVWGARNEVPGSSEKKFGLDFVKSDSQCPYLEFRFRNRINSGVPLSDDVEEIGVEEEQIEEVVVEEANKKAGGGKARPKRKKGRRIRNEAFPINNAAMYSQLKFYQRDNVPLLKLANDRDEMQVIDLPVTKEQTVQFNKQLALANSEKDGKQGRQKQRTNPPRTQIGVDLDGRPIPTFSELLFPHIKKEAYDILLQRYYAEIGHRPGCFTAEWKSRVMTGFITKYERDVFENDLGALFEKQLEIMSVTTAGWTVAHYETPLLKFKELKKKWRRALHRENMNEPNRPASPADGQPDVPQNLGPGQPPNAPRQYVLLPSNYVPPLMPSRPINMTWRDPDNYPRAVRQPLPSEVHIPFDILIYDTTNGPMFCPPTVISEYCVTRDRQLQLGRMDAKIFYDKYLYGRQNYSLDLNIGLETFDPKVGEEGLGILLEWIRKMSPEGGRLKKAIHEADFVCWRGLLTKVTATIYNKDDSWKIKAVRRKGVIFLLEEKTEQAKKREEEQTDMDKRMSYWGHKFEQYVTRDDASEEPDTSVPVTTKEEFAVVARSTLITDHRLNPDKRSVGIFYSGEVDCIDKRGEMIELKTQKGMFTNNFWKSGKALKWWLQSSFANIDNIIVGHRSDDGHIRGLSGIRTKDMPQRCTWKFHACFEFASTVFTYVLNYLEKEGDACIIEYNSEKGVHTGIHMKRVPSEACDFVPADFLDKYT